MCIIEGNLNPNPDSNPNPNNDEEKEWEMGKPWFQERNWVGIRGNSGLKKRRFGLCSLPFDNGAYCLILDDSTVERLSSNCIKQSNSKQGFQ